MAIHTVDLQARVDFQQEVSHVSEFQNLIQEFQRSKFNVYRYVAFDCSCSYLFYFVICHGILPILSLNFTKFVPFLLTLRN